MNVDADDHVSNEELQDLNKDILKRNEQLNQVYNKFHVILIILLYTYFLNYLNKMYFILDGTTFA